MYGKKDGSSHRGPPLTQQTFAQNEVQAADKCMKKDIHNMVSGLPHAMELPVPAEWERGKRTVRFVRLIAGYGIAPEVMTQ